MIGRITARDRRTLVAGSVLLTAILLLPPVARGWLAWDHRVREQAALLEQRSAESELLLRHHASVTDSLRIRERQRARLDSLLVEGESKAAISSAFAGLIVEGASQLDVTLGSIQVGLDSSRFKAPTKKQQLIRTTARFTASGSADALIGLIAWIEESPPMLSVREVALTVTQSPDGTPMGHASLVVQGLAVAPPNARTNRR